MKLSTQTTHRLRDRIESSFSIYVPIEREFLIYEETHPIHGRMSHRERGESAAAPTADISHRTAAYYNRRSSGFPARRDCESTSTRSM